MEDLLLKFSDLDSKIYALRRFCKENNFNVDILTGFNTKKIKNIYSRLQKHYSQHPLKAKTIWFQSELKLFNWILISYSFIYSKKIQDFTPQDWNCFKKVFYEKDINTFKYETKKLINQNCKQHRNWNSEEEQILLSIMDDQTLQNKWNEVGRKFFEMSNEKYFRTGKQCREHWLNHLDPSKRHGKWTSEQDLVILKFVLEYGKKWSLAYKNILPHRTEHMIKNRFKSLITKHKKKVALGEQNEISITEKIIAFYQRKQHPETTLLKSLPSAFTTKSIDPICLPIRETAVYGQNEVNQVGYNNQKVGVMIHEKNQSQTGIFTGLCYQMPVSVVWTPEYCINPMTVGIYCPSYFPGMVGMNQNWGQQN